ncbi:MAG: hypothetical protein QN122_12480 [Armatimonadota bacterium]|nr:hypothetical protein [Armatimonadota bacterium]
MRERELKQLVVEMASRFGWHVYHVPFPARVGRDGRAVGERRAAGWPDLMLLHEDPPRLVFAELKGHGGQLRESQRLALRRLSRVAEWLYEHSVGERAVAVYVWRPDMLDQVEAVLRGRVLL